MFIEAKHDSELAELSFAEAGGYDKGSKYLSKGRKKSTLEAIDINCGNFLIKSCGSIHMEECSKLTSLAVDLFIFCKSLTHQFGHGWDSQQENIAPDPRF